MKKSLVYTKTGDKGTTGLIGGTRVAKFHERLEAYGCVDELNAQLGLLVTFLSDTDRSFVLNIQNKMFSVGSYLATDQDKVSISDSSLILPADVSLLEQEIDRIDSDLPKLQAFVIPGGSRSAAICHVCRTVCRRAERRILAVSENHPVSSDLLAYINRLSDYLFVLSRKINHDEKNEEIFWMNSCK